MPLYHMAVYAKSASHRRWNGVVGKLVLVLAARERLCLRLQNNRVGRQGEILICALREAKAAGVIRLNNNRRCHMGECCEICMPGRGLGSVGL